MRHLALAFAGLVCSASASAEIITFEYSGVVNKIRQSPTGVSYDSRSVASTTVVPGGLSVGDGFRGTFSFNLDTPKFEFSPAEMGAYFGNSSDPGFSLVFDKSGAALQSAIMMVGVSNGSSDHLTITPRWSSVSSEFWFYDPSGKVFSDVSQPRTLNLNDFYEAELNMTWSVPDSSATVRVETSLLSITKVSPVPEPSTYALLFAGLAIVGGAASRKRNATLAQKG